MNQTPTIAEMMEAYALDAVDLAQTKFQQKLDFSGNSIKVVEQILEEYHISFPRGIFQRLFKSSPSPEAIDQICKIFGAYVGEVIRRSFGGEWELDGEITPSRKIMSLRNGDKKIWPPAKVHKRIVNGSEDNVWHYYQFLIERWKDGSHNNP
jgi:hypothetical protein